MHTHAQIVSQCSFCSCVLLGEFDFNKAAEYMIESCLKWNEWHRRFGKT